MTFVVVASPSTTTNDFLASLRYLFSILKKCPDKRLHGELGAMRWWQQQNAATPNSSN
jgi:hypothetical protein